jgi:hypothetical protein
MAAAGLRIVFTTETQRGDAATREAIVISPQRYLSACPHRQAEFAEFGVFFNKEKLSVQRWLIMLR